MQSHVTGWWVGPAGILLAVSGVLNPGTAQSETPRFTASKHRTRVVTVAQPRRLATATIATKDVLHRIGANPIALDTVRQRCFKPYDRPAR